MVAEATKSCGPERPRFDDGGYRELIALLRETGYGFCGYHDYAGRERCVILRHDIDCSLAAALRFAELEHSLGVRSTYFVMMTNELYNPFAAASRRVLRSIHAMGHALGLHFDETVYAAEAGGMTERILWEASALGSALELPVRAVSMHCPSPETLEADMQIPGLVNACGKTFFHDFKYLSDSSRRWREPALEIIRSRQYARLHILTHAFWYHETELDAGETLAGFVRAAGPERLEQLRRTLPGLALPDMKQTEGIFP